MHSKEDKADSFIKYDVFELIDKAVELKFDAIAITHHSAYFYPKKVVNYAKKKNLLLIPGTELKVESSDVLIYNISRREFDILFKVKENFNEFYKKIKVMKKKNKRIFVMAPHPFFILISCLGNKLIKYSDMFDAVEYSWFYSNLINLNNKGVRIAKQLNLPIFANSDAHLIELFGKNYTLVDSKECTSYSIFHSIKKNKIKIITKPVNMVKMFYYGFKMITLGLLFQMFKKH